MREIGHDATLVRDILTALAHDPRLSRKALARLLGMSESALYRTLKTYVGKTLPALKQEQQVAAACHLLTHTNCPIKEIRIAGGWLDASNFRKTFHKHTGLSPSDYRRTHQHTTTSTLSLARTARSPR